MRKTLGFLLGTIALACTFAHAAPLSNNNNDCIANIETKLIGDALSLENCQLSDNDMQALSLFLAVHPEIKLINLRKNQIAAEGVKELVRNLTQKQLLLDDNLIGDQGAAALAQNTTLAHLTVANNHISSTGAAQFAKNHTLQLIFLGNNLIDDIGAAALSKNTTLKELDLTNNKIGTSGAEILAKNETLLFLSLFTNPISDQGAKAFADNKNLQVLFLDDCGITDKGAIALTNMPEMKFLGLSLNAIGDAGAIALAASTGAKLQLIDLTYNHIGQKGMDAINQSSIPTIFAWGQHTNNMNKTMDMTVEIKASHKKVIQLYCGKHKIPSSDELVRRLCQD